MNSQVINLLLYVAVFCATFIPRLLLIGGPPATDEGIYAFNAMMIHVNSAPGGIIPDVGTLSIYPMLLSWVFGLELNQFILLRLLDAAIASVAGLLLYRVLTIESGTKLAGAIISIGFLLTMNDPVFIQYGFKNSIAAASIPLLSAIMMGLRNDVQCKLKWFWCGSLVAIAVMLREPFVAFAVLGTVAVLIKGGMRAAIGYVAGGLMTSALVLLTIMLMRGGAETLIQSYVEASHMYQGIAYQKLALLQTSPITFMMNAIGVLIAVSVILISLMLGKVFFSATSISGVLRYLFWIGLGLVPLIEPMMKNGYPYHYATTLIGLSGLLALSWHDLVGLNKSFCSWITTTLIVLVSISLLPKLHKVSNIYTKYTSQLDLTAPLTGWPDKTIRQSNYLMISEKIRHLSNNGKTNTLSINGSMLGVIPLSGLAPSRPDLAHLSYQLININNDKQKLKQQIYECPPDFIMLTSSSPFKDKSALQDVIGNMPEYSLVAFMPQSPNRSYGTFDGSIFKWVPKSNPCTNPFVDK